MQAALAKIRETNGKKWAQKLRDDEFTQWDKIMARRILVMLRHIAQALSAGRSWAATFEKKTEQRRRGAD